MDEQSVITAETMGAAARHDPQLQVPTRPRIRRGLVLDFSGGQLVVEGGPKKQLLRGKAAAELLPRLMERIDGRTDHRRLASALAVPEDTVFKALSLLWTCGVIEEGGPEKALDHRVGDELADFLSRMGDSTGANARWEQASSRLAAARVEVFGSGAPAEQLCIELAPSLEVVRSEGETPRPDTTLAVWVDSGSSTVPSPVRTCWERHVPLLRLAVRGRTAGLGPLVLHGLTACMHCSTAAEDPRDPREARDGDSALAAALLARDVFAMISRSTPGVLPMQWRSVDLETLEQQRLSAASRPGCALCSVAEGPAVERAPLAAVYEASISFPPKEFADLKAHQMHYKPSNIALQATERTWPPAPGIGLPEPDYARLGKDEGTPPAAPGGARAAAPVGAEELSLLLAMAAGRQPDATPEHIRRWTASGGNIGSVVAHAVVRDVPGLQPGVYGYLASANRLARLSADVSAVAGTAPATIALTGDFTTVSRKYSAFALRIVLLDSGCAQATVRSACAVIGVDASLRAAWDDDAVAEALGTDPDAEPVTALIDLGEAR